MTPPDLAAAIRALGASLPMAEPPEAAAAVEAWRLAWRPSRLRLLLLAESHMATSAAELACAVRLPPGLDWPVPDWPVPAGFVRHVYCPAYGEPSLVPDLPTGRAGQGPGFGRAGTGAYPGAAGRESRPDPAGLEAPCGAAGTGMQAGNAGTPQYWRLLAAVDGTPMPGRVALPLPGARLAAKAALLHRLRDRGIWLADASLVAVAGPGGARAGRAAHQAAVAESWRLYQGASLAALAPAHVVVIGRAVAGVLREALDRAFPGRWQAVPQPMGARGLVAAAALHAALAGAADRHAPPVTRTD